MSRHLVLIGYRGTGKSTVARQLGAALARPWIDADVELARRAGSSIREIFAEQGEEAFRQLESEVLEDLLRREPSVIATGGGVVMRQTNRERLAAAGTVVWLRATPESILARLHADPSTRGMRPALTEQGGITEIVELLRVRSPLYADLADQFVDTDEKNPDSVAAEILSKLSPSPDDGATTDAGESP